MNERSSQTNWHELFSKKEFWQSYQEECGGGEYLLKYFDISDEEYDELEDEDSSIPIPIPLVEGYRLEVDMLLGGGWQSLSLYQSPDDREGLELGWDDGNFCPNALRWPELLMICSYYQRQALRPFDAGYLPLLLLKFTSISQGDDLSARRDQVQDWWQRLGLFSNEEVQTLADEDMAIDDRRVLDWQFKPGLGWVAVGEDSYSRRVDADDPRQLHFHRQLAAFWQALGHCIKD